MPYIYERKLPLHQQPQRQSLAQRQPSSQKCNSQRLSAIPRPTKQLVADGSRDKPSGISHASKPTPDRLPAPTPNKNSNRIRNSTHNEHPRTPTLDSDPELAVLELVPFSGQPFVNFGEVKLGTTQANYVVLRNSRDYQQQLFVKSLPKLEKGLYMDATEFIIAPRTEICVGLAWTPQLIGSLRESITLQDVKKMSWRVVLMGTAVRPKPAPSVARSTRNVPRLFRRSPIKATKQLHQESRKALFSPRTTTVKSAKPARPLTRLYDQSPAKRHQIVRTLLSQHDQQMAVRVQSYCRMVLERRKFERLKAQIKAAIVIQSHVRRLIAERHYYKLRNATNVIQKHFRGWIEHHKYQTKREAAIRIQTWFKAKQARERYHGLRNATISLQKHIRGFLVRRRCAESRRAAVIIQRQVRMHLARQRYLKTITRVRTAATVIQKHFRGSVVRRVYQSKRYAAILIQSHFKSYLARRRYLELRGATVDLQRHIRGFLIRRQCAAAKGAAIIIQRQVRMYLARKRYLKTITRVRAASTVIQKHLKGWIARRAYQSKKRSAILIQSRFRSCRARRRYLELRDATVILQSHIRRHIMRRLYLTTIMSIDVLRQNYERLTGRNCKIVFRDEDAIEVQR